MSMSYQSSDVAPLPPDRISEKNLLEGNDHTCSILLIFKEPWRKTAATTLNCKEPKEEAMSFSLLLRGIISI